MDPSSHALHNRCFAFFSPGSLSLFLFVFPARCFSPWFSSSSFSFSSHLSHTAFSLSWSFSLRSSSCSSSLSSSPSSLLVDFSPLLCLYFLPIFSIIFVPPPFLAVFFHHPPHTVCCILSVLSTNHLTYISPPNITAATTCTLYPVPVVHASFTLPPPPPAPRPPPRHSQSVQRDELEWRLGQERGVEPQSQSQSGGQAQGRGAAGLTRYHRPLALRIEVSASFISLLLWLCGPSANLKHESGQVLTWTLFTCNCWRPRRLQRRGQSKQAVQGNGKNVSRHHCWSHAGFNSKVAQSSCFTLIFLIWLLQKSAKWSTWSSSKEDTTADRNGLHVSS